MPTNLPPEYFAVEKRYRAAETTQEKIACLEELLGTVPHHKGTDHLRADLRKRLSKLREASQHQKGAGRQESAFHIDREGAGRVVLTGVANVGKSSLVNTLTHATPDISEAPFTTWVPTPGMMPVDDIQIQLIDTPPLNRDHMEPELFNLICSVDLLLLVVDLQASPDEQLEESIDILLENRVVPRGQEEGYGGLPVRTFLPYHVVVNKCDDETFDEDFEILRELLREKRPLLPVSAATGRGLDDFARLLFERLQIMRIYSKPPNKDPDMGNPFVLPRGSNVEEFAGKVHQDFVQKLKTARIWGTGVYDGQPVGRDHVLHDGDVVELHL